MRRIIETHSTPASPTYRAYREHNLALAAGAARACSTRRATTGRSGRCDRLAEQDKLTVRERLDLLLDPGSPFLELLPLAANRHYDGEAPQALLVTGIGVVNGREVMIIADDSSLKGGSWYPLSMKKIVRALEIALENRLPVDPPAGLRRRHLPLQDEIYALGRAHLPQQCR